jgi:hypothetical protein
VAEKSDDVRECARAVHGERGGGGTDKAGPRRRERRKGDARGQRLGTGEPGPRDRERERAGEENHRRQVGPTGQRAREGGRARGITAADRRGPPVRRHGRAGAWPGWAKWAGWVAFPFSFSLDFLIPFLFLFL